MRSNEGRQWFVMRDLKRVNAKQPAYKLLDSLGIQVFTPKRENIAIRQGKRIREEVPFIQDLLFVCETRQKLDSIVERTPTLQYRWSRNSYREPMVVADNEMQRFMYAVNTSTSPQHYMPEEITPDMYGRKIRIVGGPLDGYEGFLLTKRGSKVKRLLVEIKGFVAVSVEVNPDFILFI